MPASSPVPASQRSARPQPPDAGGDEPYDRGDPTVVTERELLKLALQWPALCGPEFDALGSEAFSAALHASVFKLIADCGGVVTAGRVRDWVAKLIEAAPDDGARAFITELAVERFKIPGEPDTRYVDIQLAEVGVRAMDRQIARIKARLQRMNPVEEQAAHYRLFGDLMMLEQRRKTLLDRATGA